MISIKTDVNALKIQRNLSNVTDALVNATKRLTTGEKITQAKDDAAGLFISSGLSTRIRALNVGVNATQTGTSILNIAEGSISNMKNALLRIRDLAVEGSSDYYPTDARNALQNEADSLIDEIYREKEGCNFNGKKLLDSEPVIANAVKQSNANSNDVDCFGVSPLNDTNSSPPVIAKGDNVIESESTQFIFNTAQ